MKGWSCAPAAVKSADLATPGEVLASGLAGVGKWPGLAGGCWQVAPEGAKRAGVLARG